jgi:hypothetical protein
MRAARNLTVLSVVAALALSALPVEAAQRRERRDGEGASRGDHSSAGERRAAPLGSDNAERRPGPESPVNQDLVVVAPNVVVQGRGSRGSALRAHRGPVFRPPPYRFSHPYYTFRPQVSIGLGLWAGHAVPFPRLGHVVPYGYAVPYAYPAPYAVPYPVPYPAPYPSSSYPAQAPSASINAAPSTPAYGGVSIDITPIDAEVWVDGGYAGPAGDFGPQAQPLTLEVGVHRLEMRAPGYLPLAFNVTITPGYVIPYQGVLQPAP